MMNLFFVHLERRQESEFYLNCRYESQKILLKKYDQKLLKLANKNHLSVFFPFGSFNSAEIRLNIIDLPMSCESMNKISGMDASLDFQKEFTYINLIQEELSKDKKPSRLKIHSKISAALGQKNQNTHKKNNNTNITSRSEIRKKSKTVEKSLSKKKLSARKSVQKNYENSNKKSSKTVETRHKEIKLKSTKSLKCGNSKRQPKEQPVKKNDLNGKKKKLKDELSPKVPKKNKSQANKSGTKTKINKTKSESEFEQIPLSEIKKQAKIGPKESKIIHQYFGMQDKLSSIVEEKSKKHKRNQSKLSKCKTQSSSSSISLKNGLKFLPKGLKQKK